MIRNIASQFLIKRYLQAKHLSTRGSLINCLHKELTGLFLTDKEWESISLDWGKKNYWHHPIYSSDQLFDWEQDAVNNYFPHPPASVLIIAAGMGREMRALQKMGYSVFGMELDGDALNHARNSCIPELLLGASQGSFFDIASGKLKLPDISFGAIVIGWVGLTHLSSEATASKLFSLLTSQYPHTPILISWVPYEPISRFSKVYRQIRSNIPFLRSYLQGMLHPVQGPMQAISYERLSTFLKRLNIEVLYGKIDLDCGHMVVRGSNIVMY